MLNEHLTVLWCGLALGALGCWLAAKKPFYVFVASGAVGCAILGSRGLGTWEQEAVFGVYLLFCLPLARLSGRLGRGKKK